jgi:hypothetical protein
VPLKPGEGAVQQTCEGLSIFILGLEMVIEKGITEPSAFFAFASSLKGLTIDAIESFYLAAIRFDSGTGLRRNI